MITSRSVGVYRASETCVTCISNYYKPNGTVRGVIWCHGANATADGVYTDAVGFPARALAEAGYPVVYADLGGASPFGNDTAIAAITDAKTFLQADPATTVGGLKAKAGGVYLAGVSMGTLALNWARANPSSVLGAAFAIPVLDLQATYVNNPNGLRTSIQTAYGVTYPTALPGLSTHSPVAYPTDVTGFPVKLWAASDDTVGQNLTACQSWQTAVGSNVTVVSLGAVGHALTGLTGQEWVAFFDSIGRT